MPADGPDFLYIGCQKAGSRWLYDQLSAHKAFWMPPTKEFHYFDGYEVAGRLVRGLSKGQKAENKIRRPRSLLRKLLKRNNLSRRQSFIEQVKAGDSGKMDLDWYASLFRWKGDRLSGDITPDYATLSAGTISVITSRFPNLRFILFVRDPVARLWSSACMAQRRGVRLPKDWPEMVAFLSNKRVAAQSYPSRIFVRWREYVPAERIFVGFFDQLASEPEVLRADVLRFLGAGSSPPAIEPGFDRKRDQPRVPCPPDMQRRLADWFADELEACATTFGGPATKWPRRYRSTSADP
jgi:Sulfotransferase family